MFEENILEDNYNDDTLFDDGLFEENDYGLDEDEEGVMYDEDFDDKEPEW